MTARFEIYQTLFLSSFQGTVALTAGALASTAGVPSGDAVTREATTTSLGVAWESKVGGCAVCSLLRTAAGGWGPLL